MLKVERVAEAYPSVGKGMGFSISVEWLAFNWSTVNSLIKTGGKSKYTDAESVDELLQW